MSAATDEAPLTTAAELSARLRCSLEHVRRECRAGRWPYRRLARQYRFTEADVASIVALLAEGSAEQAASEPPPKPRARRTYAAYTRRGDA